MAEEVDVKTDQSVVNQLFALVGRFSRAMRMGADSPGLTYDGDRNLYEALGYKDELGFKEFFFKYSRHAIGKAVIERMTSATFRGGLGLFVANPDEEVHPFDVRYAEIEKEFSLSDVYGRADRLAMLGRYSGILLGFNDVRNAEDMLRPPSENSELLFVRPLGETHLRIVELDKRVTSSRYSLPRAYDVTIEEESFGNSGSLNSIVRRDDAVVSSSTVRVHHERVIHIAYDLLESNVYGIPLLKSIYNNLDDLEKLVGGSAEMFWRGARPGYSGKVADDFVLAPDAKKDLQEQVDEFEHNLKRVFINKGIELEALAQQVADPMSPFQVQIQMISAATGIPQRILTGSERGELASTEDRDNWFERISARRGVVGKAMILKLVDRLIKYGVLPDPGEDGYKVKWDDLYSLSDKQKAEIARLYSEVLKNYVTSMGYEVIPIEMFAKLFLHLTDAQAEELKSYIDMAILEESQITQTGETGSAT